MSIEILKTYAEKSGKTLAEVQHVWDHAKQVAASRFPVQNKAFWKYVAPTTKTTIGLSKHQASRLRSVR